MSDTSTPNILLVVLDTARASNALGRPEVMPNLHSLAREGVTFENAFTTAPWTLPSHASMFTGQYTTDHDTHAGTKRFDPDVPPLPELLGSAGYQTVGISNNTWVSSDFGFDRGFEDFFVGWELFDGGADLAAIAKREDGTLDQSRAVLSELASLDAPKTVLNGLYSKLIRKRYDNGAWLTNKRAGRWLGNRWTADRPFFMFINYLEPHLEYDPPKRFREPFVPDDMDDAFVERVNQDAWAYNTGNVEMSDREFAALEALYDGELHYLDHRLGALFERLDSLDALDETVVVVVGDHGENIGEHELMDHQYCLYDTLLHVPLVIRYPVRFESGATSDDLVEVRDLYPTLLELANADPPSDPAVSSNSLVTGSSRDRVVGEYAVPQPSMEALEARVDSLSPAVERFDRALRSLRTTEWKYIEGTDGSVELYDVASDPGESADVSASNPAVCEEFAAELADSRGPLTEGTSDGAGDDMRAETKQRLEDLGYLQ
ncbi:sulfatase [Haloferacaceae archaeon DSL9]